MILTIIFLCIQPFAIASEEYSLRHVESKNCGQCHQQIYQQWQSSMHAQSTALQDPIHGAFYQGVIGGPKLEGIKKNGKYPVCLQCHAPTAAKDGKTKLDSLAVYQEGVNCITCHTLTKFKGTKKAGGGFRLGISAYEYSDTKLQGPSVDKVHPRIGGSDESTLFEIKGNSALLKTNNVCLGCHEQRNNSNKVPLCQTGSEIASVDNAADCQSCHMPVVNGMRDHSMLGGHSKKMVSQGVLLSLSMQDKQQLAVTLKNQLPHNFPTGAPFRNVFLRITAYDATDKVVWRNTASHPIQDDKKSVLMYALGDDEGRPAAPPKATQVMYDSRLKPFESRIINYELPQINIVKVKVELLYDLLLPTLKKRFAGKIPSDLRQSKLIVTKEITLVKKYRINYNLL